MIFNRSYFLKNQVDVFFFFLNTRRQTAKNKAVWGWLPFLILSSTPCPICQPHQVTPSQTVGGCRSMELCESQRGSDWEIRHHRSSHHMVRSSSYTFKFPNLTLFFFFFVFYPLHCETSIVWRICNQYDTSLLNSLFFALQCRSRDLSLSLIFIFLKAVLVEVAFPVEFLKSNFDAHGSLFHLLLWKFNLNCFPSFFLKFVLPSLVYF